MPAAGPAILERMPDRGTGSPGSAVPGTAVRDQARSNRSAFMTLFQAAAKSRTNFSCASSWP